MGAINNLLEKAKHLIPSALGGISREQIAEEERKATEKKAQDEQKTAMEREKKELEDAERKSTIEQKRIEEEKRAREAIEKVRKDFLDNIEKTIKEGTVIISAYEVLSPGATEQEIVDGGKLRKQSFKLELSTGNSYSASVIVTNDPDHISYKSGVTLWSFLNWRGMSETITHTFPGNQGLIL